MLARTIAKWRHRDGSVLIFCTNGTVHLKSGPVGAYNPVAQGVGLRWAEEYARGLKGFVRWGLPGIPRESA